MPPGQLYPRRGRSRSWEQISDKSAKKPDDKLRVHVFVYVPYVLQQVLPDGRELRAVHSDHTKFSNLAKSAEVKQGKANDLTFRSASGTIAATVPLTPIYEHAAFACETIGLLLKAGLTFLSDFEAPVPVHPVVYSPFHSEVSMTDLLEMSLIASRGALTVPPVIGP